MGRYGSLSVACDADHPEILVELKVVLAVSAFCVINLKDPVDDERHRIFKRANDGRTAAKARGTRFGRKPKLTDHQQAEALKRLAAGESCRSIAKTMAVHHATVARLAG